MNGRIYIIKNTINDKVYIGQTLMSLEERLKQHINHSKSKNHYKLYQAMDEIGKDKFYIELLEDDVPINKLDEREIYWINFYNSCVNGYNTSKGGKARHDNKIQDIQVVFDYLDAGFMVREVASILEVHSSTINRMLKSNGYKTGSHYRCEDWRGDLFKIVDRSKVKVLLDQDLSYGEIANELHINKRTVGRIAKEFGISKRKRIDYSKIDLAAYEKDWSLYKQGLIQKQEINEKYGLNQNSYLILNRMIEQNKEKCID